MITSVNQISKIKEIIQVELLKRGFTAEILNFCENVKNGKPRLEFYTATFQTTPVMFKELEIRNFSSWLTKETVENMEGEKTFDKFTIEVAVKYTLFEGGYNWTILFRVSGLLYGKDVFKIKIE